MHAYQISHSDVHDCLRRELQPGRRRDSYEFMSRCTAVLAMSTRVSGTGNRIWNHTGIGRHCGAARKQALSLEHSNRPT